ncbi:hypothetical protein, partial [Aeromonas hydrophila]|uniref:hypothetical protein n=1 Tax=Aeromonas hydrophila TaxID=644 RepID=UPI001F05D686
YSDTGGYRQKQKVTTQSSASLDKLILSSPICENIPARIRTSHDQKNQSGLGLSLLQYHLDYHEDICRHTERIRQYYFRGHSLGHGPGGGIDRAGGRT